KLVVTGLFESVCNVSGEMNSVASCVITTKTSWPCLTSRLASSADLYAAIDPVTPRTIDFLPGRMRTTFRALVLSRLPLESFSIQDGELSRESCVGEADSFLLSFGFVLSIGR